MKRIVVGIFFLFISSSFANTQEQEVWVREWIPKKRKIFTSLLADPWETCQTILVLNDYNLTGKIGAQVPIYGAILGKISEPVKEFQMYVDLLTYNSMRYRIEELRGFDLNTSDTKFGLQLEYKRKKWGGRFGIEHISGHLADGLLWPIQKKEKQYFSREFFQFHISHDFPQFIPYAGIHYIFHQNYGHEKFLNVQWGGEYFFPLLQKLSFFKQIDAFIAADFQSKEEFRFFINQSYIAGFRFLGESEEPFRFGFHYYTGYDPRGEFFNSQTTIWGMGFQKPL